MRKPHRVGRVRFVEAAPAIHQLELGNELTGLNRLTARVPSRTEPVKLAIRHAEEEQGVHTVNLPPGNARTVELTYPITIDSLDRLIVELSGAQQTCFRQPVNTFVTPSVSAAEVDASLDLLGRVAASAVDEKF